MVENLEKKFNGFWGACFEENGNSGRNFWDIDPDELVGHCPLIGGESPTTYAFIDNNDNIITRSDSKIYSEIEDFKGKYIELGNSKYFVSLRLNDRP